MSQNLEELKTKLDELEKLRLELYGKEATKLKKTKKRTKKIIKSFLKQKKQKAWEIKMLKRVLFLQSFL